MKFFFSFLLMMVIVPVFAQDMHISLFAKGEKLSVSLDEDNSNKSFIIKKENITAKDYFTVIVSGEVIDNDWKRSFTIHNNTDSEIASLNYMNNNSYCIAIKDLSSKLQSGSHYYLYTIAMPTDPKKAMLVKVARNLVCKIIIKD